MIGVSVMDLLENAVCMPQRASTVSVGMFAWRRAAFFLGLLTFSCLSLSTSAFAEVKGLNIHAPHEHWPRVSRSYPSMNKVFSRRGYARSLAQVDKVKIGSTKRQLVNAVGKPVSAYSDGSWNFNIGLRLPQGNRLVCQYLVFFDDDGRVNGTAWRRPQCVDLILRKR